MKKILSLLLALSMILSVGLFTVNAAEVSTAFLDGETFFYSFESESDFSHAGMKLDEQGTDNFKDPELANYTTPGYGGSGGAVGIHVETAVNNGNTSSGVIGFNMYPGKEYEFTMKLKLFSTENLKAAPQIGMFFMTSSQEVFTDAECTQSAGVSSSNYQYTSYTTSDIFPVENGKVYDGWATFTKKVSISNIFSGNKYVPMDKPVRLNLFLRIGGVHSLEDKSIFTDEFLANCGTHTSGGKERASLWFEYAIDDIGLRPASYESTPQEEEDPALWRVNFDDNNWISSVPGANVHYGYASKSQIVTDVPEEIAGTSKGALEATYSQHNGNGGYMEFNIYTSNESQNIQYNQAYLMSFWMKGSEAMAKYYADSAVNKSKKTLLIAERPEPARLDRTWPMWNSYTLQQPITSEWTKYNILWYEDMPNALGKGVENSWQMKFHVRTTAVPGTTDANYVWTCSDGSTYGIKDFKVYIDEFVMMPLDLAYNGDFARDGSDTDWSSILYKGATNKTTTTLNSDVISASAFTSGTVTADESFAAATGIHNENVLKVTENDGAPTQKIRMENNTPYRISFWAKADDAESVGKQINTVLDRDIIGPVRDNKPVTFTNVPKWASYRLDTNDTKDVTYNTEGYDGYGELTGETGSIPNYMYAGPIGNYYHNPIELKPANYEETLVYDDYYDRAFSKNTQAGKAASAWMYQYYNGSEWVNTNETAFSTENVLSDEWTYYEMDYKWNYEGKHYRIPDLVIDADANFSLADIKVEEMPNLEGVPAEFTAENIHVASASNLLSTGDEITVTWDLANLNPVKTDEAAGALVKVYADNNGVRSLIGTTAAEEPGKATLEATAALFGKKLVVEVTPKDVNGNFGLPASAATEAKVALSLESSFKLGYPETSADWSVSIKSANEEGLATVYAVAYDANKQMVGMQATDLTYKNGDNTLSGNFKFTDEAVTLKLFLWDANFAPMLEEKVINMMPVVKNPFEGDDTINVVYLGDSLYAGAGASANEEKWVYQVGAWFEETFEKDGVTVNNFYKGAGGTTTEYSAARIFRDVINNDPDVVYFSHTCNDSNRDTRRNMEFVVRSLMELENPPYIIMTRSTNRGLSESNGYGNQVAEHYNLPWIDDRDAYIRALAKNGNTMADYFIQDGVHPNDLGYDVITEEIIARMETGRYWHRATEPAEKLIPNAGAITAMDNFCSNDARVTKTGFTTISNGVRSTAVGDTLSFSFTGNVLAFSYGLNMYTSKLEVYVDGNLVSIIDPYYPNLTNNQLVGKENSIIYDLSNGPHEVVVKTATGQNTSSTPQTTIYDIFVGTWH